MLADGGFDVVMAVILGAAALIRWLMSKGENSPDEPEAIRPAKPARAPSQSGSEDERMRRFLEALGVPANPSTQAPKPRPVRAEPTPPQMPGTLPVPPIVRRPVNIDSSRPMMPGAQPPPFPAPARSLDAAPAPTTPASQIHLAHLQVPIVREFVTESSTVTAIPGERQIAAQPIEVNPLDRPDLVELQRIIRSPRDLRAAFVLREILGAPRGLQSVERLSTLP